jgi:S-adenosylmethionine:tRNA ribosyltransferase-isomerase
MISLEDLHYHLPEEQIAQYPLSERDGSRLLSFQKGQIEHHLFKQLPDVLPANSLLVFNTSKVIPARLVFQKSTGAKIEILLLQPREEGIGMQIDLTPNHALWHAMIGNAKK